MKARMLAKAGAYLVRATRLRCPVCGRTPIFPRVRTIRRPVDWFMPFDGCPRCGYAFEREPGYFLMAVWALNCGFASVLGLVIYLGLEMNFDLPMRVTIPAVLVPVALFNVLFARHAKAYFIALDHLFDPHERGGGDNRGNQPIDPHPEPPAPGLSRPIPTEPCETTPAVR
ncbi:MAG: DUF983 domain-containing protein [Terrimicrobiaceae bacterium]|nr:DUF983 domain-containing protein [Terrimicrobiaceae bacterium]